MNSSFTKEYIVLLDKRRTMEKELLTLIEEIRNEKVA